MVSPLPTGTPLNSERAYIQSEKSKKSKFIYCMDTLLAHCTFSSCQNVSSKTHVCAFELYNLAESTFGLFLEDLLLILTDRWSHAQHSLRRICQRRDFPNFDIYFDYPKYIRRLFNLVCALNMWNYFQDITGIIFQQQDINVLVTPNLVWSCSNLVHYKSFSLNHINTAPFLCAYSCQNLYKSVLVAYCTCHLLYNFPSAGQGLTTF